MCDQCAVKLIKPVQLLHLIRVECVIYQYVLNKYHT